MSRKPKSTNRAKVAARRVPPAPQPENWTVEVLNATVASEIETLSARLRASLTRIIERIETIGLVNVHEPHVKHLDGEIWEMRPSADGVIARALYVAATGKRVVIVFASQKKTRKTPRRWIELAEQRAKTIQS